MKTITPLAGAFDRAIKQPQEIDFHMADGVFVKHIVIPAGGSIVPQHVHEYDHTSFLAKGAMYVWEDGVPQGRLDAPQGILIKAGVKHLFQTIEDDTVLLCIHNLHGEQAVKVLAEHELEF